VKIQDGKAAVGLLVISRWKVDDEIALVAEKA